MIVKLLTEHHLEFLSLEEGCRGLSKSTLVKMPRCWKCHALAQFYHKYLHALTMSVATMCSNSGDMEAS